MTWIIPTLSRPKQCAELVKEAHRLDPSAQGVVFVNGKSHEKEYVELVGNHLPDGWTMHLHQENIGALGSLNWLLQTYPNEPFYGFIGDDEYVYTKDWSKQLVEAAGSWSIAHANDGWQSGARIHSFVCIGGNLARSVGYLAVPQCWHWYGFDKMWEMLSKELPLRRFLENVETEHRHPLRHKVAEDDCYKLGESKKQEDEGAFNAWVKNDMPGIVERIKKHRLF